MAEAVRLVDPRSLRENEENPRIIFREDELRALEESIASQGVLVPLTVFEDDHHRNHYILLDGERRWRCALRLNMPAVPVIVQPKPSRLANIMMMFAIHHAREAWDPLPTALKLRDLEAEFTQREGRPPKIRELAGLASMRQGEVQRLRAMLNLPDKYQKELLEELDKPRSQQSLKVDHVLEATRGASALAKQDVISREEEEPLVDAVLDKFRRGVIDNTVAPRELVRIARAVEEKKLPRETARAVATRLQQEPTYTISEAAQDTVAQIEMERSLEQAANRLGEKIEQHRDQRYHVSPQLRTVLQNLANLIYEVTAE